MPTIYRPSYYSQKDRIALRPLKLRVNRQEFEVLRALVAAGHRAIFLEIEDMDEEEPGFLDDQDLGLRLVEEMLEIMRWEPIGQRKTMDIEIPSFVLDLTQVYLDAARGYKFYGEAFGFVDASCPNCRAMREQEMSQIEDVYHQLGENMPQLTREDVALIAGRLWLKMEHALRRSRREGALPFSLN
jgi:hypothetical protein